MIKPMTKEVFADFVWENQTEGIGFDFYEEYDMESGETEGGYHVGTIRFADAMMVLANYYGGSAAYFCYETEWDSDSALFKKAFIAYLHDCGFKEIVWVETEAIHE